MNVMVWPDYELNRDGCVRSFTLVRCYTHHDCVVVLPSVDKGIDVLQPLLSLLFPTKTITESFTSYINRAGEQKQPRRGL